MQRDPGVLRGVLSVAVSVAGVLAVVHPGVAAAQDGTIAIPIRWCSIEGSSATERPDCACEDSTRDVLWRRHARTTEAVFLPHCNVSLRSGAFREQPTYPVVSDPCDPTEDSTCPGETGDVRYDFDGDLEELNAALSACYQAWKAEGVGTVGVIGLNVRRYVDADGRNRKVRGLSGTPVFNSTASQVGSGAFSVSDNDFKLVPTGCTPVACEDLDGIPDPTDSLLGHEVGHAVSLPHLSEPVTLLFPDGPPPDVLTTGGPGQDAVECPFLLLSPTSQCGQLRLQALCHVAGAAPFPGRGPIVDELPLTTNPVLPGAVDLDLLALVDDLPSGRAIVVWRTRGTLPAEGEPVTYSVAVDLDDDPETGGAPEDLGLALPMRGAELVGRVEVNPIPVPRGSGEAPTHASLWRFDGGRFVAVTDVAAEARSLEWTADFETGSERFRSGGLVALDLDRGLLAAGTAIRVQARAEDPFTGAADLTTEEVLHLAEPPLPVCVVDPFQAPPGGRTTVRAAGLLPGRQVEVFLGSERVGVGITAASGETRVDFTVPPGTQVTERGLAVYVGEAAERSALTAFCTMRIEEPGDCNFNGNPDGSDIGTGASKDRNDNDRPDECEEGFAGCVFAGEATGTGQITVTIEGFSETCFLGAAAFGGETAEELVETLTLGAHPCLEEQGIRVMADGNTLRAEGFLLNTGRLTCDVSVAGITHEEIPAIPALSAVALALLAFLLAAAGRRRLSRRVRPPAAPAAPPRPRSAPGRRRRCSGRRAGSPPG